MQLKFQLHLTRYEKLEVSLMAENSTYSALNLKINFEEVAYFGSNQVSKSASVNRRAHNPKLRIAMGSNTMKINWHPR